MTTATKSEVVLDEITLYVHVEHDGTDKFPWLWAVTTTPNLPRIGKYVNTLNTTVLKTSFTLTRLGAIWEARRWCRKNAARLAGRGPGNRYERFTYTVNWKTD